MLALPEWKIYCPISLSLKTIVSCLWGFAHSSSEHDVVPGAYLVSTHGFTVRVSTGPASALIKSIGQLRDL